MKKFTVKVKHLREALVLLSPAIDPSPLNAVLENFLFEFLDGNLKITASNGAVTISTNIEVLDNLHPSRALFPSKIVLDTIKGLVGDEVEIHIEMDTRSAELFNGAGRYKMSIIDAVAYDGVAIGTVSGSSLEITAGELHSALAASLPFVSLDELRPAMTGVYVHVHNDRVVFVSTDGSRLCRFATTVQTDDSSLSMIIPKRAGTILKGVLQTLDSNLPVKVEYSGMYITVEADGKIFTARILEEAFPDYNRVIPTENTVHVQVDTSVILPALKRIHLYADRSTQQLKLSVTSGKIQLQSFDVDFGKEAKEELNLADHQGDDITIGFNSKFLLDVFSHIGSPVAYLAMSKPDRACVISIPEQTDSLILIMPVLIRDLTAA